MAGKIKLLPLPLALALFHLKHAPTIAIACAGRCCRCYSSCRHCRVQVARMPSTLLESCVFVQTDGHNCGVWAYVVLELFIQYMRSETFGQRAFATFFEHNPDFTSLTGLRGELRDAAIELNEAFIEKTRDELRAVRL